MSVIFQQAVEQWRAMRADYDAYLQAHMEAAETETKGVLLNHRGVTAGVNVRDLFLRAPNFVKAYASRELLDYWQHTPRTTVAEFEAQWAANQDHHH